VPKEALVLLEITSQRHQSQRSVLTRAADSLGYVRHKHGDMWDLTLYFYSSFIYRRDAGIAQSV